jgi:hypothetical protein
MHVMHVASETIIGRHSGIRGPAFIPVAEALQDLSGYETWSRFCLEKVELVLAKAVASRTAAPEQAMH